MGLTVYTIDKLAIDVKTGVERAFALEDRGVEFPVESLRHDAER